MNLSISNIAWTPKDRTKVYSFLNQQKVKGIEIAPKLLLHDIKDIFKLNKKEVAKHLKELRRYDLQIISMQSLLFDAKDCFLFQSIKQRNNFVNHLSKIIKLAKKLGIQNLVFGSPKNRIIPPNMKYIDAEKIAINTFKKIGKIAKQNNVYISIESNPKEYGTNFLNTIHQAHDFVKKVNSKNIKLILDIGSILMNSENKEIHKIIKKCINSINHVHISEPYLKLIQNKNFIKKVISILKKHEYKKWISIEMRGNNKNNYTNVVKAINLVKRYI